MKNLILIFLMTSSLIYPFSYDSAIHKAQKGNWQDAHNALNSIITDNPDRADVVYDAGVAAYNLGNKCHAATCFTRAAECSTDKNIAFCAHFNAGNVYVDEKKLERALQEYDKALAIEPENEYARHNRDRVKQMLEEQKQQQNKQDQNEHNEKQDKDQEKQDQEKNDQNKDDQQEKDEQQDKQDQQNQKQNGNDQKSSNGNDKKDGQDQKNDSSKDESSNEQSQGNGEQRDAADDGKDAQRKKHGNNKEDKHHNAGNDKKRDGNQKFDKQPQDAQKEGKEQEGDKHGTTPEQANVSEHNQINESEQGGQELAITDPWLLNVLNNQEMHDKAVNKQLMEAKIRQHGGKNGQNCW
jgi:Ca-activated chloride channel homolog